MSWLVDQSPLYKYFVNILYMPYINYNLLRYYTVSVESFFI